MTRIITLGEPFQVTGDKVVIQNETENEYVLYTSVDGQNFYSSGSSIAGIDDTSIGDITRGLFLRVGDTLDTEITFKLIDAGK